MWRMQEAGRLQLHRQPHFAIPAEQVFQDVALDFNGNENESLMTLGTAISITLELSLENRLLSSPVRCRTRHSASSYI